MGKKVIVRKKGEEVSDNRSVKIATGVKQWWTRRWRREKSWKLFRKTQYKQIRVSKKKLAKAKAHWKLKHNLSGRCRFGLFFR